MEDWLEHYRRWSIEYDSEAAYGHFRYRLSNLLQQAKLNLSYSLADRLNLFVGRHVIHPHDSLELSYYLEYAENTAEHVTMIQAMFRVFEKSKNTDMGKKFYKLVEEALEISPNINMQLVRSGKSVILYPKGAALLDSGIINQSLSWLSTHPVVLEHFSGALKRYIELADKDEESQRSLRDELRFSVEQLLKEILENNKNLPNQAEPLEAWMKQKGSNPQVIGLYKNLLFGRYKLYQDDVKHSGTYDPQDLEFMIYLTGTFIRQLLQLERSE